MSDFCKTGCHSYLPRNHTLGSSSPVPTRVWPYNLVGWSAGQHQMQCKQTLTLEMYLCIGGCSVFLKLYYHMRKPGLVCRMMNNTWPSHPCCPTWQSANFQVYEWGHRLLTQPPVCQLMRGSRASPAEISQAGSNQNWLILKIRSWPNGCFKPVNFRVDYSTAKGGTKMDN